MCACLQWIFACACVRVRVMHDYERRIMPENKVARHVQSLHSIMTYTLAVARVLSRSYFPRSSFPRAHMRLLCPNPLCLSLFLSVFLSHSLSFSCRRAFSLSLSRVLSHARVNSDAHSRARTHTHIHTAGTNKKRQTNVRCMSYRNC